MRIFKQLPIPALGVAAALFSALTACGSAQTVDDTAPVAKAPPSVEVAVSERAPPAAQLDPLYLRCQERMAKARQDRADILKAAQAPAADPMAILNIFNDLSIQADNADNESGLMRAVHPDAVVRDAAGECEKLVAAFKTELSLDRPLYDVFAALKVDDKTADVKRLVAKTLEEFHRSGVDKDEPTRQRIRQLNDDLVSVGQAFDKAIASDVRFIDVEPRQLAGLPQDWIDGHKPCSKTAAANPQADQRCVEGKVRITTNYPDYIPFMSYATDDAARKELYTVYRQRAWPANQANLDKLLRLRHELATTLGFPNWAAYITANKMIKTEKNVDEFIAKVTADSDARMKRELEVLLQELRKTDKNATIVQDWQQIYLLGQAKKQKYDFDAQAMRPYLSYDKVKKGLLDLTSKLFAIRYEPNTKAPKWHTDVEVYDVFEGEHRLGTIYLDMHPRADKFKHAAQFALQNGVAGRQLPIGVLVCNFPNPTGGNAWMEPKDVETFFHEFGHLLHHTLGGHQKWQRFAGVATEWDFVEAPSQIFEEWAKDYEVLRQFATDAKGETVPKVLIDKLRHSDDFGKALWVRHQMFYASLSLGLHRSNPAGLDQDAFVIATQGKYSPFPALPGTHMQASFGHLNGYSAIYYTYMWSLVIAKDMFSKFKKHGILDPKTALEYRQAVLEPGGSKDAADLVADFLGRRYSFDSFADWLNQKK